MIHSNYQIPETTNKSLEHKAPSNCVETLGLAKIQPHILICADQTSANCCSKQASLEPWEHLKQRLKELKLDWPRDSHPICIFRT